MNITIGRYPCPSKQDREATPEDVHFPADIWESYIEPEDRSWILYVGKDGGFSFWPEREPSGAVIGEPVTR